MKRLFNNKYSPCFLSIFYKCYRNNKYINNSVNSTYNNNRFKIRTTCQ